jgi:transposase
MDDRTLYTPIFGVTRPWEVTRVELDDGAKAVHVWLAEHPGTPFVCPDCRTVSPLHDHVERSWRHLDTCQLRDAAPCESASRALPRAWREDRPRALGGGALPLHAALRGVGHRLAQRGDAGRGRSSARSHAGRGEWHRRTRCAARPRRRPTVAAPYLGIDEHSHLKHFQCVTMVVDLEAHTVLRVADDRMLRLSISQTPLSGRSVCSVRAHRSPSRVRSASRAPR